MPGEVTDNLLGGQIPNADDVIAAAGRQPIGAAEAQGHDLAVGIFQREFFAAGGDVPHVDFVVFAGGGQAFAVGRESQSANAVAVRGKLLLDGAVGVVPETHVAVAAAGGQQFAVVREG